MNRYTPSIIDSHCHLDFEDFKHDIEEVIQRSIKNGVTEMVVPGVSRSRWDNQLELCKRHQSLHFTLGLHPLFLSQHEVGDFDYLVSQCELTPPIAIGEIGLDFFDKSLPQDQQLDLFRTQLEIAQWQQLPVILHVRKAHEEVIKLIKQHTFFGGIVHAFNGNINQAHRYIDCGFKLGFGGMLTFDRSRKLRDLVQKLPLDSMVLETDAPDMTVASHRGERNSPEYLPECLKTMANLRQESVQQVALQTSENCRTVLRI